MEYMTLDEIALKYKTDKASPWHNYCYVYEKHFAKWRNVPIDILEIGVQFGLSLNTWAEFFPNAQIYGVDIDCAHCPITSSRVHLIEGDGANPETYSGYAGSPTIIVDDGSHLAADQREAFNILWPRLTPGGIYAIEDVGTWFDPYFNCLDAAKALMWLLQSAVHQSGKSYHGKPGGPSKEPLTFFEKTVESIEITKDLVILTKRFLKI